MQRLLDDLAPASQVVDLGCGPGEPATRLLAQQHRVIGVDASSAQLALAREAAPTALLVQADMTRIAFRPGSVDAIASFYALGHVPSDRHAALFSHMARWLRPGGMLLTSAPVGAGDERDGNWLGVPMFFGGIGESATRVAVEAAGLVVNEWQVVEEDEGTDQTVRLLWLIATKPDEGK